MNRDENPTSHTKHGFTLVEMLAVISIITLLISILLIALSGALTESRRAQTSSIMQSIETGVEQFRNDVGYLPPQVLAGSDWSTSDGSISTPSLELGTGSIASVPDLQAIDERTSTNLEARVGRYMSDFTVSVYLMGIGDFNGDSNDGTAIIGAQAEQAALNDGIAGPGIKAPGPSKAWKSTDALSSGLLEHEAQPTGRTFGPYLDPGTFAPYLQFDETRGLYRIVDAFDTPIRFYSGLPNRTNTGDATLLRMPPELWTEAWASAAVAGNSPEAGDDRELLGAEYVLLSAGTQIEDYRSAANQTFAFFGDVLLDDSDEATIISIANPLLNTASFDFAQVNSGSYQDVLFLEAIRSNVRLAR